jgi:hypothetical protein
MKTLKSIGAVVAGFLTVVLLSVVTDAILEKTGVLPPVSGAPYVTWMLLLALAYRSVFTVAGGYVTARLAPDRPMRLVTILGILGTIGGIAGVVGGWNLSAHWYPIALAIGAFPCVWLGGKLGAKRITPTVVA